MTELLSIFTIAMCSLLPVEEDSTVMYSSCDSIQLAATIALPQDGKDRHPAVVLMSGTGKQDRDGMMAGHPVFKEISDYLAERGVAVLRTDDRGTGKSGGHYEYATTEDFAADALAAVDYLKSRADIDARHIGLVGHSEGGASISIAASRSQDVAFIVSLAGLMTDGLSSVKQQNYDILDASPMTEYDRTRYRGIIDILFPLAYKYADSDSLEQKLLSAYDKWKPEDDAFFKKVQADSLAAGKKIEFDHFRFPIYMYAKEASSPWYRFFIRYNPADYLSKVNVPVLLVNGDKDIMVNAQQNIGNARRYLAHNKRVEWRIFPGQNHLLLQCERGTPDEYSRIESGVSPELLKYVCDWIKATVNEK